MPQEADANTFDRIRLSLNYVRGENAYFTFKYQFKKTYLHTLRNFKADLGNLSDMDP